jgi:hypothetical protein
MGDGLGSLGVDGEVAGIRWEARNGYTSIEMDCRASPVG